MGTVILFHSSPQELHLLCKFWGAFQCPQTEVWQLHSYNIKQTTCSILNPNSKTEKCYLVDAVTLLESEILPVISRCTTAGLSTGFSVPSSGSSSDCSSFTSSSSSKRSFICTKIYPQLMGGKALLRGPKNYKNMRNIKNRVSKRRKFFNFRNSRNTMPLLWETYTLHPQKKKKAAT